MVCNYNFTIEWYAGLSKACYDCPFVAEDCFRPHCVPVDGRRRGLIATNRQVPGPHIEVCEGDTVVVAVRNFMEDGSGTTLHWHGITQAGTQYMDGTNMVTQCPISHRSTFVYEFEAVPAGTHLWHSHTQFQRGDGLFGGFVIKQAPDQDPHYDLYDHDCDSPSGDCEFNAIVNDWFGEPATVDYIMGRHASNRGDVEMSSLLNGLGQMEEFEDEEGNIVKIPRNIFQVTQGKRYRFRVVSATNGRCCYKTSVEGHSLTLISADGAPLSPEPIDVFNICAGESYDFVMTADQPVGSYWFKFHGVLGCSDNNVYGVIQYEGSTETEPSTDPLIDQLGVFVNPVFSPSSRCQEAPLCSHGEGQDITVEQLFYVDFEDWSDEVVEATYYVGMDSVSSDNTRFQNAEYYPFDVMQRRGLASGHIVLDNITFQLPSSPPLSQPDEFFATTNVCNRETVDHDFCYENSCFCSNVFGFEVGQVVELIMVNEHNGPGNGGHPMHLHGYTFRLVGMEKLADSTHVEEVKAMNEAGLLPRKLLSPSHRDTVNVPDGGYAIYRFKTDNPGFWAIHCHVEGHVDQGQVAVMWVGDFPDFPPVPDNFPRCGNFDARQSAAYDRRHKDQLMASSKPSGQTRLQRFYDNVHRNMDIKHSFHHKSSHIKASIFHQEDEPDMEPQIQDSPHEPAQNIDEDPRHQL